MSSISNNRKWFPKYKAETFKDKRTKRKRTRSDKNRQAIKEAEAEIAEIRASKRYPWE